MSEDRQVLLCCRHSSLPAPHVIPPHRAPCVDRVLSLAFMLFKYWLSVDVRIFGVGLLGRLSATANPGEVILLSVSVHCIQSKVSHTEWQVCAGGLLLAFQLF